MIFEWDDFGANHEISDMCQSHDCRDVLLLLKKVNPVFKATLFAIPGEMTWELLEWCRANDSWIELAVHGFYHRSNYECEKMTYEEFDNLMDEFYEVIDRCFVKGFRAPGWQISDDIYKWLKDNDWWVADQDYNNDRRPTALPAYVNYDGQFVVQKPSEYISSTYIEVDAYHGHTWNVGWNGIYEDFEKVKELVKTTDDFKFVSELFV